MTNNTPDYDENDCCGNGCANCVLELKKPLSASSRQNADQTDSIGQRINLLHSYRKYRLLTRKPHFPDSNEEQIYELHFKYEWKDENESLTNSDSMKDDRPKEMKRDPEEVENGVDEEKKYILGMQAGHHLMLRVPWQEIPQEAIGGEEKLTQKYLLRPYSPFWWHEDDFEFKILIDFRLQGPMSAYFRQILKEGDLLEFRGPIGVYDYQLDSSQDESSDGVLVILTQGIAIAPVIPIIEQILQNEEDYQRILHLSCFRHLHSICFRDKIQDFNHYWNYQGYVFLSQHKCKHPECIRNDYCSLNCPEFHKQLKYDEKFYPFRLNSDVLHDILEQSLRKVAGSGKLPEAIITGSQDFQKHYQNTLLSDKFQFNAKRIHLL